ncbi:hypothetical protein ACNSPG_22405 (plasmid) [Brucella pituitosa]|uniref:hypothetical protein n=1 Tax=Brucella pituitosa TaxID=571256 RepID=UPI003C750364
MTTAVVVTCFTTVAVASSEKPNFLDIAENHGFLEAALENCPHAKIANPKLRDEWSRLVTDRSLQAQFENGKQLFLESDDMSKQCYSAVMMRDIFDPSSLETWLEDDGGKTKADYDQGFDDRLNKASNEIIAKRSIPDKFKDLIETESFASAVGILNSATRFCGNVILKEEYTSSFKNTPYIYSQMQSNYLLNISLKSARNFQDGYDRDPLAACGYAKREYRRYLK